MPTSTATLVYTATAAGVASGALGVQMAKVPLPQALLTRLGVKINSDSTVSDVRTIVLGLVPTTPATATAQRFPGDPTGSPIDTLTVTANGAGYAAPPDVFITDSPPALVPLPGGGFPQNEFGRGASARALLDVHAVTITDGGTGYTGVPTVTFVGGFGPKGGTPATGTAVVAAGSVTGVTMTSGGSGYVGIPQVVFSGGAPVTPAHGTAVLEVASLLLLNPGEFYVNPQVELRPHFKALFPDAGDQRAPFWSFIKVQIERYLASPVSASAPVIA